MLVMLHSGAKFQGVCRVTPCCATTVPPGDRVDSSDRLLPARTYVTSGEWPGQATSGNMIRQSTRRPTPPRAPSWRTRPSTLPPAPWVPTPPAASLPPPGTVGDGTPGGIVSDAVPSSRLACPPLRPDSESDRRCVGPRGSESMASGSGCGRSIAATALKQCPERSPPARPQSAPGLNGI